MHMCRITVVIPFIIYQAFADSSRSCLQYLNFGLCWRRDSPQSRFLGGQFDIFLIDLIPGSWSREWGARPMNAHSLTVKLCPLRIGYGTNNMFETESILLLKNWTTLICTLVFFARLWWCWAVLCWLNMRCCKPPKNISGPCMGNRPSRQK